MVAEGTVDVAAEPALELYDMAALVPIVTEAGGRFTSLDGEHGCTGPDAVATNGILHEAVLAALAPDDPTPWAREDESRRPETQHDDA